MKRKRSNAYDTVLGRTSRLQIYMHVKQTCQEPGDKEAAMLPALTPVKAMHPA